MKAIALLENYMTVTEVCGLLDLHRCTVIKLIEKHDLGGKVAGTYRVSTSALYNWLNKEHGPEDAV